VTQAGHALAGSWIRRRWRKTNKTAGEVKRVPAGVAGGVKDQARGLARIEVKIKRPVKGGRIGAVVGSRAGVSPEPARFSPSLAVFMTFVGGVRRLSADHEARHGLPRRADLFKRAIRPGISRRRGQGPPA